MKQLGKKLILLLLVLEMNNAFSQSNNLYQTIASLDSTFFAAYNNCNIQTQASMFADSIEFYHDKSGLSTSKKDILESTQKYICGKVARELVEGSIEVSPVPGYGAVEIGMHRFHNLVEKSVSRPSKFVIIWKNTGDKWVMSKVISLH